MPSRRPPSWVPAAAAALALTCLHAEAAVIGNNVAPSTRSAVVGQTTTANVTWTVVNSLLAPSSTSTVTSFGAFLPTCTLTPTFVLGTPTNPVLTSTIPTGGANTVTHSIAETVTIPADLIQRARDAGLSAIQYIRRFFVPPTIEVGDPGRFACVTISITGSGGQGFSVTREALSFDDLSPVRIIPRDGKLRAQADMTYTGIGLLQAVWEVAEPPSTSGEPIYRVLSQVRQPLTLGVTQTVKSPELPTGLVGLYLLRLRITDPVPGFESPVIRYFVGEGRPGKELPAQPLALGGPAPASLFAAGTRFSWESVAGARAYQLEVYATGREIDVLLPDLGSGARAPDVPDVAKALSRPAVTGMLVPGSQTQSVLSPSAQSRLKPGSTYLWRVLAIGADGSVIAQSPMRELRVP